MNGKLLAVNERKNVFFLLGSHRLIKSSDLSEDCLPEICLKIVSPFQLMALDELNSCYQQQQQIKILMSG